ncbi:hypothetical protein FPQ18DRAFT_300971 [Pyronema domesticum]|uniref:Rhodopsin domain-containing protein n=1 Tax=Pyronema omphalodes (strain CBS 100304) TaxID=1076935 RepID=U4L8N4_PYROM|nr:hypothetical protein FPQ18DRAFT_300971 [Pyronema domesticum]CCX15043.1 Similar to hypothetical protein [Tuber melanosporum Mel28]; acc. no. XP_002835288 [Pyronema omphalodes CBS 100304]
MAPATPSAAADSWTWSMPVPDDYGTTTYVPQARGYALLLTELIMISVTLLIVGLRLYTRVRILGAMHSDDWWIMLATSVLVGLTVIHGVGVKYGIGKHIYDISTEDSNIALTMGYIGQILYVASLACVKISLLLFLQRIFPSSAMRRTLRGILIFVLCFSVTNIFLFAFQCDTPEYYFQKIKATAKKSGGVCLAPQVVYYPMAAINIVTDFVIWLLPVPMIIKARLTRREKLGLLWVFIIGGVAVGAAIVRPVYLRDIMEDGDPTWNMVNVSVWAMIEISIAIMCTSIPVIKPLVLRVAPRLLLSTGERSGRPGAESYPRDGYASNPRRNSFAMRSIKVTHDIHQVEDDVDTEGSLNYGLQQPAVTLGFDEYEKRRISSGPNSSDDALVRPISAEYPLGKKATSSLP